MSYSTSDFRKGLKIEDEGEPYVIVDFMHVKPGKGGAFVRTKLKSLLSGSVVSRTYRSGHKVGRPDLETKTVQYLYSDGTDFHMMDTSTYEQLQLSKEQLGDKVNYLKEEMEVSVLLYKERPIQVEFDQTYVELQVTATEPGVRGDTATNVTKPATVETGYTLPVPLFINDGDWIKVDTRSGDYGGKVSGK